MLTRYLRAKSPINDAEFVIHYRDNSTGAVPGPSDWDIRAAMEVADIAPWRTGWEACPAGDAGHGTDLLLPWARDLVEHRPAWKVLGEPHCFHDPHHHAAVAFIYDDGLLVVYRNASEL